MALVANQSEIGLERIGTTVYVPGNPRAKLMFYLECMCVVLELDDPDIKRLTDYENHARLTVEDETRLLILCLMLSPDVLNNKCIFQDDDMCGDSNNEFYELSAVRNRLLVTENILIGDQQRHVKKIMCYKMQFLHENYLLPMVALKGRLDALVAPEQQSRPAITYNQHTAVTVPYSPQTVYVDR